MPIIMLRNINQPKLCNGTRLSVKKNYDQHHRSKHFDRAFQKWRYPHSLIPMIPTDMSFQFKRLQFPIRLTSEITINKAQGQSLELCGLYLHTDCFSHRQLYVACSRVSNPDNLFIYTETGTTKRLLWIHKYWKIKHIRNMHFLFFSPI